MFRIQQVVFPFRTQEITRNSFHAHFWKALVKDFGGRSSPWLQSGKLDEESSLQYTEDLKKQKCFQWANELPLHLRTFTCLVFDRYGDRCPQSIPAKIFAMAWFLVGLSIFTIFMGFLTTTLTVTIVKKDSIVHYQETDDGKVITSLKNLLHSLALQWYQFNIDIHFAAMESVRVFKVGLLLTCHK